MRPSRSWDSELLCHVTDNNYTILDTMRNFIVKSVMKEAGILLVVNGAFGCYG